MKKIILLFILILTTQPLMASVYDDMAGEIFKKIPIKNRAKAIAIMPFRYSGDLRDPSIIAVSEMEKAFVNAGAVVSERGEIDKLIKEQELQQTGLLTDAAASDIGKGVGAKYILLGNIAVIDKYGESGNRGIKISIKLVDVSTYRITAVSSGEASLGDATSKYKRQSVKKAAEYPEFLEIYGGVTIFKYSGDFDEVIGTNDTEIDKKMNTGYAAGIRYINDNRGFLTTAWDFNYTNQDIDSPVTEIMTFQLSWIPIIRFPLWTYADSLPDYTNIYFGYAIGVGINKAEYTDIGEDESSKGFGFCSSALAGFKLGLSESISIFAEARYTPGYLNKYWRNQDINESKTFVDEKITGPSFYFGLSLAP